MTRRRQTRNRDTDAIVAPVSRAVFDPAYMEHAGTGFARLRQLSFALRNDPSISEIALAAQLLSSAAKAYADEKEPKKRDRAVVHALGLSLRPGAKSAGIRHAAIYAYICDLVEANVTSAEAYRHASRKFSLSQARVKAIYLEIRAGQNTDFED